MVRKKDDMYGSMEAGAEWAKDTPRRPSEDDMMGGDLGDGLGKKPGALYARKEDRLDSLDLEAPRVASNGPGDSGTVAFTWTSCAALQQEGDAERPCSHWRLTGSLCDLSNEELKTRLQEATEKTEILRCELEATQRHLEGKHEALKILQSRAVFDKATTHTKTLLQKSEERNKALEKEVNDLQWEITFNQGRFKNIEQSWKDKYERMCIENKTLSDTVEETAKMVQELRSENTFLSQRCLELMSLLSVEQQRAFKGSLPVCSGLGRDGTALELAVLGACCCSGSERNPCPCARTAATSRKQVLQLTQEVEMQRRRKEEAYVMADAFRIAFEQQLKRRSDQVLHLAEKGSHLRRNVLGHRGERSVKVAQKLRGMLQTTAEGQTSNDPPDTLHHLIDLLNDKEEALAHQRKVSYMLAQNTAELEQRLLQLKGLDSGMADLMAGLEAGNTDGQLGKHLSVPHNPGDNADTQKHRQIKGKLTMEPA
ncbi:coiled-coil domain-containing protein 125-like isoform X2 [Brienomyrus brachyistius]|uniref:coiled-coil domain-containing protein 125-like isoform X2 n=1 Tax=Brienomyrus brachyistius TaxID=42636 RepID=UPI0020B37DEA|nr:coiled-coil domain-containing protein 125-like isoform X2 [Brienomyrus brachyistius]XP_048861573.1 coiled-coil domain-containing protein 125-like isoform X2 [Brienomyrus brachyistius]